jgi:hypothetical protein
MVQIKFPGYKAASPMPVAVVIFDGSEPKLDIVQERKSYSFIDVEINSTDP